MDLVPGAAKNDHAFHGSLLPQRIVHIFLQRNDCTAAISAVRRDDGDRAAVRNAISNAVRAESTEDNRMHRADAGTGQHRDGRFRNRWQINDDAIALADLVSLQNIREPADFVVELLVGECALVARLTFPENRCFVAARAG